MVRAQVPAGAAIARAAGPVSPYERAHVLRCEPPERTRRYRELADKLDFGTITAEELRHLEALVAESEQLMLENSHALLRHRDPQAYAEALAEERRALRGARPRGTRQRCQPAE